MKRLVNNVLCVLPSFLLDVYIITNLMESDMDRIICSNQVSRPLRKSELCISRPSVFFNDAVMMLHWFKICRFVQYHCCLTHVYFDVYVVICADEPLNASYM